MNWLNFVSRDGLIRFVARRLGVELWVAQHAFDTADRGLDTLGAGSVLSIVRSGNWAEVMTEVYDRFLSDPDKWPIAASVASGFLQEHDPRGALVPVFSLLAELPLEGMTNDYASVEDFLERGVFPLIKRMVEGNRNNQPACPTCHGALQVAGEGDGKIHICATCEEIYT